MKKLFALLLVLVMVIALVPTAVAAIEAEGTPPPWRVRKLPATLRATKTPRIPNP